MIVTRASGMGDVLYCHVYDSCAAIFAIFVLIARLIRQNVLCFHLRVEIAALSAISVTSTISATSALMLTR